MLQNQRARQKTINSKALPPPLPLNPSSPAPAVDLPPLALHLIDAAPPPQPRPLPKPNAEPNASIVFYLVMPALLAVALGIGLLLPFHPSSRSSATSLSPPRTSRGTGSQTPRAILRWRGETQRRRPRAPLAEDRVAPSPSLSFLLPTPLAHADLSFRLDLIAANDLITISHLFAAQRRARRHTPPRPRGQHLAPLPALLFAMLIAREILAPPTRAPSGAPRS